jgi:acetyl-CoA carboxylase alpha subunit
MKITAPDLVALGIVTKWCPRPPGAAHADPRRLFRTLDAVLERQLGSCAP